MGAMLDNLGYEGSHLQRAAQDVGQVGHNLTRLLDVAGVFKGAPLERKVQAALEDLYDVLDELPRVAADSTLLYEHQPLVFPVPERDMRAWWTSDGRRAGVLVAGRQAARLASASRVVPAATFTRYYRPLAASQYLRLLEDAVVTDPPARAGRYRRSAVLVGS